MTCMLLYLVAGALTSLHDLDLNCGECLSIVSIISYLKCVDWDPEWSNSYRFLKIFSIV